MDTQEVEVGSWAWIAGINGVGGEVRHRNVDIPEPGDRLGGKVCRNTGCRCNGCGRT